MRKRGLAKTGWPVKQHMLHALAAFFHGAQRNLQSFHQVTLADIFVHAAWAHRSRRLLGVEAASTRDEILAAHKRLVALVHPDRGGSNGQVHEANAARDILLDELPHQPNIPET